MVKLFYYFLLLVFDIDQYKCVYTNWKSHFQFWFCCYWSILFCTISCFIISSTCSISFKNSIINNKAIMDERLYLHSSCISDSYKLQNSNKIFLVFCMHKENSTCNHDHLHVRQSKQRHHWYIISSNNIHMFCSILLAILTQIHPYTLLCMLRNETILICMFNKLYRTICLILKNDRAN